MSRPSSRKEKREREGVATGSDGEVGAIGPLVGVRVTGKLSGGRESKLRPLPITTADREVIEAGSPRQGLQTNFNFVAMATSKSHVLCLNENGQVYACGQGIAGQLGLGKDIRFTSALTPVAIGESSGGTAPYVVHVACGFSQSAAITRQGRMFWWGSGHSASWTPQEVVLANYHISQCALGNAHILVVAYPTTTGEGAPTGATLFGMGDNKHGQLGIDESMIDVLVPLDPPLSDHTIVEIACGYQHSAALTDNGQLYFWGSFLASDARPQPPTLISLGDNVRGVSCTCSSDSVLVLTDRGEVYTYGYALDDELAPVLHLQPQLVTELAEKRVVSISSSTSKHAAIVHRGGQSGETEVYMWGDLDHKDTPRTVHQPLLMEELADHRVLQIGCGQRFVVLLTDERHAEETSDRSHCFEKVQVSIPVRCQICSHFAFGLRHGLWKCADCGLVCHSKCRDDAIGCCEPSPSLRSSGSLPSSPSVDPRKSSGSKDKTSEIAEQEAKVLRRWAKAQSDFASDFVRHVSSTKLREMAPDAFNSTTGAKVTTRSSPLTIDRGPASPRRRPGSSRDSSTRSSRERQSTGVGSSELPNSLEEEPLFPSPRAPTRRGSGGIDDLLLGTDEEEDDGPTPGELDADDKAGRIQATRLKLAYHRKKVRELEEELALLLAEERFADKISESEGEDTDLEPPVSPKENASSLSESFEEPAEALVRARPATKGLRNRPASARPSERLHLSVEKIFIDKTWTIDPSQVQIEKQLGEGASAIVYLGQYRGQNVAIKVMKDQVGNKRLLDFQFEFQILREMKSKYNVYFYGACLNPNLCLLMEYCERGSLYSCLNDPNLRLRWPRILKIALEMCRGVSFLHSWEPQIVHRDLKSHNLLIDSNWNVKIADFGLARLNTAPSRNTLSRLRGTYTYCAPEIYYGYPFTEQADVFSIGVILWEMVVRVIKGRYERPYSEFPELEYDFQVIVQTARGKRCTIPPTTPAPLSKLIRSCWEVEPEARPSSRELVAAIHNLSRDYRNNQEEWDWALLK